MRQTRGSPAGVAGLCAGWVGGDNDTSGPVNAAGHRRRLRAAIGTGRDDDGVMTRPDEVEQFLSCDHRVRCDLRAHQLTIPSRSGSSTLWILLVIPHRFQRTALTLCGRIGCIAGPR